MIMSCQVKVLDNSLESVKQCTLLKESDALLILRKKINPDGGESTETKGSEVQWRRLRRAVCGDLDALVSRYFQDDRFVCKRNNQ